MGLLPVARVGWALDRPLRGGAGLALRIRREDEELGRDGTGRAVDLQEARVKARHHDCGELGG